MGQAEDETKLWDMALLTPYQLGSLKFFSFYVDLSAVASYGAWAEFVLQPTGAFKVTSTSATFSTAEGHEVAIDSTENVGTIRFGSGSLAGGSYSIAEALPQGAARKLLEEEPSRTPTIERVTTEYACCAWHFALSAACLSSRRLLPFPRPHVRCARSATLPSPSPHRRRDELILPREEARLRRRLGRRGGGPRSSGFAMSAGGGRGNRCGND